MSNLENLNNIDFLTEKQKFTENLKYMSLIEDICNSEQRKNLLNMCNSYLSN